MVLSVTAELQNQQLIETFRFLLRGKIGTSKQRALNRYLALELVCATVLLGTAQREKTLMSR